MSWPLFHTLFLAQQPQCWMEAYNCRAAPSHLPLHLLFLWSFISAVWSYFALSLGRGHLSSHLPQAEDSSVHRTAGHVDPSKWGMLYLSQEKRQKMYAGDTDRALFLSHVKELHWIMFFKANNCHNWRWELHFSNIFSQSKQWKHRKKCADVVKQCGIITVPVFTVEQLASENLCDATQAAVFTYKHTSLTFHVRT